MKLQSAILAPALLAILLVGCGPTKDQTCASGATDTTAEEGQAEEFLAMKEYDSAETAYGKAGSYRTNCVYATNGVAQEWNQAHLALDTFGLATAFLGSGMRGDSDKLKSSAKDLSEDLLRKRNLPSDIRQLMLKLRAATSN